MRTQRRAKSASPRARATTPRAFAAAAHDPWSPRAAQQATDIDDLLEELAESMADSCRTDDIDIMLNDVMDEVTYTEIDEMFFSSRWAPSRTPHAQHVHSTHTHTHSHTPTRAHNMHDYSEPAQAQHPCLHRRRRRHHQRTTRGVPHQTGAFALRVSRPERHRFPAGF